ncbi:hypothetical protein [Lacibacter sediminis]|uniref:DUF2029 domain-containing protein n=1 Tax=Lacibacter sediminis TaxID=2760713 RepID=A0A7G5XHP6_9BACT|nr:hypothetical protein [Lacibacter sediminis]QNA44999.1 hypothetical protein H4075_02050 [Lacibacter sediminis]
MTRNRLAFFKGNLSNRKIFFLLLAVWFFAVITSRPVSVREPFRYGSFIKKDISQINSDELHVNFYYLVFQNPYNGQAHLYVKKYIETHPEDGPDKNGGVSHLLKRNIRVGIPILANLFRLQVWHFYILQFVAAFVFLILLYKTILIVNLNKPEQAFWFVLAFACSIIFKQFFIDPGHWDVYAWLFMMLTIWLALKGNLLFILTFTFALLTDERTLFSIPVIAILLWCQALVPERERKLMKFINGCTVALIILFIWRYHFINTVNDRDFSGISVRYIIYNLRAIASSLFLSYEFLWLLAYAVLVFIIKSRMYKQVAIIAFLFLPSLLVTFMVADLARSIGYLFPFFILIIQQYQQSAIATGVISIKHVAILNAVFPSYYPFLYSSTISDYPPFWGFYELVVPAFNWASELLDKLLL